MLVRKSRRSLTGKPASADIAAFPWVLRFEFQSIDLRAYPHVVSWYLRLAGRPAVQAGYSVPKPDDIPVPPSSDRD